MPVYLVRRVLLQQLDPLLRAAHRLETPFRLFSQECPSLLLSGHSIITILALVLVLSLNSLLRRFRHPVAMVSMKTPRSGGRKREKGGSLRNTRYTYHRSRMSTIIRIALTVYIVSVANVGFALFFPFSLAIDVCVYIYVCI